MRELEMSAKTVEEAVQAACDALGVDRDDLNVSYEVLEFPTKKLFRTMPARIRLIVEEPAPQEAAPAPAEAPQAAAAPQPQKPQAAEPPAPQEAAAPAEAPAQELDLAAEPRLQQAVEYLTPICEALGAANLTFTATRSGEVTLLHVAGDRLGALIGRRGETMESLGYLASLVVNRSETPYLKLGLDVGGYRAKREQDLTALARRTAERVARTGYSFELEPMNPYERHIVHAAVSTVEGARSESRGEGTERRVVIYSTVPGASNLPDRGGYRAPRQGGRRGDRRPSYSGRGPARGSYDRGPRDRGPRPDRRDRRGGYRPSGTPEREFATRPRDPGAQPTVPSRSERIHDGDEFAFGKIDL